MDIKELDKKQLILLTLLITFVVSIATGIVTVSLMNQMPKSVPQTINNVIQRTIEKVTTVQVPTPVPNTNDKVDNTTVAPKEDTVSLFGDNADALVPIYLSSTDTSAITSTASDTNGTAATPSSDVTSGSEVISNNMPEAVGQGIIVSDIGLILVDSNIIKSYESYKVILNKIEFDVSVLKKFDNGFTILKISPMTNTTGSTPDTTTNPTQ
jgi:hypothetical protein